MCGLQLYQERGSWSKYDIHDYRQGENHVKSLYP